VATGHSMGQGGPLSSNCLIARMITLSIGSSTAGGPGRVPLSISSTASEPSQVYRLRPSGRLRIALILLPALAAIGLLVSAGLPGSIRLPGLLITLAVTVVALRCHWPDADRGPWGFRLESSGRCRVLCADGSEEVALVTDALILPFLVVISLRGSGCRRALVIPSDALDGESHRRLRREAKAW